MAEFFRFLVETNIVTAAFVIGAIAFIIAVIGKVKTIIEPSPTMRLVLALFGLFLMGLSASSYFFVQSQPTTEIAELPTQVTPTTTPSPTTYPTPTQPGGQVSSPTEIATEPPPTQAPSGRSCIAKEQGPLAQGNHTFAGPIHVVQLWRQNGQSPWGTNEVMAVVTGDVTIIGAGGNVWTYPSAECESVARIHMLDGANIRGSIVVTEEELREAGLIK
jgi:disulfide bond formation protein DsbB